MNTDYFITTTAHFFDVDFNLRTFVLTTEKLLANHTGHYLSDVLNKTFNEWNIKSKISAIVLDSGANIKSAVNILKIPHLSCVAHMLNLVVKHSLVTDSCREHDDMRTSDTVERDEMKCIIILCQSIVRHFKHSEVSTRLLSEKQQQMSVPVLKLKQDI